MKLRVNRRDIKKNLNVMTTTAVSLAVLFKNNICYSSFWKINTMSNWLDWQHTGSFERYLMPR
jgi:hypothetical protein